MGRPNNSRSTDLNVVTDLIILGGGGHASSVAETAIACGFHIVGHAGPHMSNRGLLGPYLGTDNTILSFNGPHPQAKVAIGLGFVDVQSRKVFENLLTKLQTSDRKLATVIHPTATVFRSASLGLGVFVAAHAVVGSGSQINDYTIINTGTIVDHDCIVGAGVHLGIAVRLCGNVTVGAKTLVGAGSVVLQNLHIGRQAIVGAGAVVVKTVKDGTTVYGVGASDRLAQGSVV